jgi:type IV secretion system protein VirB9
MSVQEAPALLILDSSSKQNLVNYRLKEDKYIVDKLFESAVLLLGVGVDQERIMIYKINSNANKKHSHNILNILTGDEDEND